MGDDKQAGAGPDSQHKQVLATGTEDTEGQSLHHKTLAVGSEDAHKTLAADDDTEGQSLNHKTLSTPEGDEPMGPSGAAKKVL